MTSGTQGQAYSQQAAPTSHEASRKREVPHSIDFEQALLACCILEGGRESVSQCVESKIHPESFYLPAHQIVFRSILELYQEGQPCDEIILADKLESKKQLKLIGGLAHIHAIVSRIDTPAHITYYIKRVRDLELTRRVINVSLKTVEQAYQENDDIDFFLEKVEHEVFAISEDRLQESAKHIKHSIEQTVTLVHNMLRNHGALTGISSGFKDLDVLTFGLHRSEMIVVAARPSMGKTALALNIAEHVILPKGKQQPVPTLMFSLEMSAEQLALRLLCSHARVNMTKLKEGFLATEASKALADAANEIKQAPFWIDESASMNILEIRAKARRMDHKHKLGLIIIDYLQLISGTDSRVQREQQISEISRSIKAMAKELQVPVIVLSQLNRESEKERRQPRISDLRESGSIEQDADLVLLLARKKDSDDEEQVGGEHIVVRELIVAKQRNGPTGIVPLTFVKHLTRFENYTSSRENETFENSEN
jgi:replicative DNA helicase